MKGSRRHTHLQDMLKKPLIDYCPGDVFSTRPTLQTFGPAARPLWTWTFMPIRRVQLRACWTWLCWWPIPRSWKPCWSRAQTSPSICPPSPWSASRFVCRSQWESCSSSQVRKWAQRYLLFSFHLELKNQQQQQVLHPHTSAGFFPLPQQHQVHQLLKNNSLTIDLPAVTTATGVRV